MTFSNEWEKLYSKNFHMSVWPWSDLISYVKRYVKFPTSSYNVLELGCGAGANIPFFLSLNANYHGLDGSQTIIENLKQQFPQIKENLLIEDFTKEIPFENKFDLIVDRAALTCNSSFAIKNCLNLISNKLSDNGIFIGIDWYSTEHSEYSNGKNTNDEYTKKDFVKGTFKDTGLVHFSSKQHLEELFSEFKFLILEHKIIRNVLNNSNHDFASWNFVAQKNN